MLPLLKDPITKESVKGLRPLSACSDLTQSFGFSSIIKVSQREKQVEAPMPVYKYEHTEKACSLGKVIEVKQSMQDMPLAKCPNCGGPIRRIISAFYVNTPKSDTGLRDMGFTKLVRR